MASPIASTGVQIVTTGSPYRVILRLATPTVLAMLTQSIVNEVDVYFFSLLPQPEASFAQAALFPSLILLWAFGGSLSAISVGTQAITARRFAEGEYGKAGGVLLNSWLFSAAASLVVTLIGYASLPWVLAKLIAVPEVRAAAQEYLHWRLLGISSMVVTFSFKAFFDGIGKTHVHMISAVVMNVWNIIFCIAFIFGNWGAPRMGIAGAGLAGFASTWIGLFIMIGWAALPKYRRDFGPFAFPKRSSPLTWDILKLSIPSGVATLAVMTGFLLFSFIVNKLDEMTGAEKTVGMTGALEPVNGAATTVIVAVLKLTFTACLAFGTSTATLVSQSLGAGDPDKAARFGWASVRLGLVIFAVVGFLEGVVFPREILSIFAPSEAVLEAAMMPMQVMGFCTPLIAVAMILTQALFGAGNTRFVMIVELVLHFTCLVPLAWILGVTLDFGLIGIWSAAVIYVVALCAVMVHKFARGDWRGIRI